MRPHGPAPPRAIPLSRWSAFDALDLVQPGRVLLLDVAAPQGHRLAMDLLAGALAARRSAFVVDGANWLDVYRLGEAAERHGLSRADALGHVRVARGFTAYQLQSLVEDALPRLLAEGPAGLVLVPGLPDLYQDEDLQRDEGRVLLGRALDALRAQATEHAVPVVVTNTTLPPHRPTLLRRALEEGVDARVALLPAPHDGLRLLLPGARPLLAPRPGTRQRSLDEYGAEADALGGPRGAYRVLVPVDPRVRYAPSRAGEQRVRREAAASPG
jgi:hypothetical protein